MLWKDGRSGESGRYVGNLVLKHLDPTGNLISHHKGTVFVDSLHFWVGRVVADDAYLNAGVLHWANVSVDQHRELLHLAKETRRELLYLFITAYPSSQIIKFWQVPSGVLDRELDRHGKGRGSVLGLHISDRGGRHMLGEEDVTDHYTEFKIDAGSSSELITAVRTDRKKKDRPRHLESENISDNLNFAERKIDPAARRFDIPLSGDRSATLIAPVPMTAQDVIRIKGYIDLMNDLLVS